MSANVVQSERGMRLCDIAEAAGLKTPTAFNILKTLSAKRLVEKKADANIYSVGSGLEEMFLKSRSGSVLRQCEVVMLQLQCKYSELVITYSAIRSGEIMTLLRLSSDRPGIIQKPIGMRHSPYMQSSGLVALAYGEEGDLADIEAHHPFAEEGAARWNNQKVLKDELSQVRSLGYAIIENERRLALAVPVFDTTHTFTGVFGVSVQASVTVDQAALIQDMKDASLVLRDSGD
ncbi:MAG: IclR family transcriptional regulator domain-containing protein [Planctomycetota bacterium]|jgi:DNA-binding IclR family transcriptional regulator